MWGWVWAVACGGWGMRDLGTAYSRWAGDGRGPSRLQVGMRRRQYEGAPNCRRVAFAAGILLRYLRAGLASYV